MGRLVKIDNRTDNNTVSSGKKGRLVRVSDTPERELGYMIRDAEKRETSVPQPSSTTNNTARQQPRANSFVQGSGMSKFQQMEAQREERQQKSQNPSRSDKAAQIVQEAEARSPRARSVQKADTGTLNDRGSVQRARNGYELGEKRSRDTRVGKAVQSIGLNTIGSAEMLGEGLKQTNENVDILAGDQIYSQLQGQYEQMGRQLNGAVQRYGMNSQEAESIRQSMNALREQLTARRGEIEKGIDTNSHAYRTAQMGQEAAGQALEGLSGVGGFLGETALSIADNASLLPLAAINPALPLVIMSIKAAGSRAKELTDQGAAAGEALSRGVVSGIIEGLSENVSLGSFLEMVNTGGRGWLLNLLKQAGVEGAEEISSYIANYAMDKAAQDPNTQFDAGEMLRQGASGALSGLVFGGAGTAVNRMNGYSGVDYSQVDSIQGNGAPSAIERSVQNVRQTLGAEGQSTFDQMRTEGQDPSAAVEYTERFVDAYNKGKRNEAIPQAEEMTDAEAETRAAWNAGRVDALTREGVRNKQNQATREAGAGIIRTEYTDSLDQNTVSALDRAAKQLGVTVEFADEVAGGSANAEIQGNRITIEKWNRNPVRALFGHEITHRIQALSPDSYGEYKTVVRNAMGADFDRLVGDYQRDALENGFEYSRVQAEDEVVADFAGDLLQKDGALERFIQSAQSKPTLLQRIVQVFRDLVNKLRGTEKAQAERALGKLEKAYREAAKAEKKNGAEREGVRYSLKNVPSVKPTNEDWSPGASFDQVKKAHPTLFELAADEADTRNPTQITGTVKSYRKIYDKLRAEGFDGTILDASSGLGYGTRAGRTEYGFSVDDIEPFPDAKYHPNYTDYSTLDKTYDVIISNAVLNVIPQDLRDAMVVKIGEMLNPGGRAFINVRGSDVKNAGSKVAINANQMEYFISNTGSYQKGFTSKELVGYLRDALGDGFTVEPTKEFGAVSAVVTKKNVAKKETRYSLKARGVYEYTDAEKKQHAKKDGVLPLGDKQIAEQRKTLTWDEANELFQRQEGLSYRFYNRDDPMSRAGYAMFADDAYRNGSAYGGDHARAFSVAEQDLTPISELESKIVEARHRSDENTPWVLEDYADLDDSEFAKLFDPDDIVQSADAWDNEDLVQWFAEEVVLPMDEPIAGVKTSDGAIAFDRDIIRRNLPAEVVFSHVDDGKYSLKRPAELQNAYDEIKTRVDSAKPQAGEKVGVSYDAKSESYSPADMGRRFSLKTWNDSEYTRAKAETAAQMAKELGISERKANDYIDAVNGIARMIADDRVRLDYEASPGRSSFVSNTEYGGSVDFSTICKKRRLLTGTMEAIQKALPNTALTADEVLRIRKMMKDKGYEVSCGLCYVEGSRANMGMYAKEFLEEYKKTNPAYVPNMAEINTPSGLEALRAQHPEVYAAYEKHMNGLAQRKPKLYQMATEYQGEILKKFRGKGKMVEEKNRNGGLRIQSFSDFEIIHLLDMMQVVTDMSRVGLAGQAYTKVPDFAWAMGDTGVKINLSLIAKDVDSRGNLVFDNVEGMPLDDAMQLRGRYPKNVGTILVGFTPEQIKAAMADDRIDFIIPFHRSQWNSKQYATMGLPENAKDFTPWQNESYIEPVLNKNGKKQRPANYMPNEYWDFSQSGKENAERYLQMCAENNRKPKFSNFLVDNGDGSWSLQPDGSTDGYWKLLIDFKMYDNEGNGAPQMPVRPDFNLEESQRMLREYTGGHNRFPVAQDIVDEFLKGRKNETQFSRKTTSALFNAYKDINQRLQEGEITQEQATQEKATALDRIYTGYVQSYGEMAPGENPARKVSVPKQTSDTTKVSQTIRTIMEAKATPESILPTLKESIANGDFDYETYTDAAAKADAEKTIRDVGWDKAQRKWFNAMENGIVTKENTALGWTLYNNAVNSGNTELAIDVLNQMVKSQRNAAQALQATRILKQLSPEGQLYQVQRSVADLQREINNRYRKDGAPKLEIDKDLAKKLMEAKDQNARDKVLEEIYKDIGRQMPSRFIDKWNAWRYLAMLGNPRTHVRNIVGNAGFMPVVGTKNLIAQGIETVASKFNPGMERTKGMFSAKLFKAALADYANVEGTAMSGGKYSDYAVANKYVEEGRQIFGTSRWNLWNKTGGRALETLRKKNSAALDTEDVWFSKPHYANAMAQYCKANGITAEQIRSGDEKVLRKARAYAVQEAAKATYRDTNALSEAVSSIGGRWRSSDNKVKRVTGTLVDGILPFRKTPANILARGLEYSPAGLLKGLTNDLVQVKKGNMTAAQAIDNISAGLTGTGLLMLGGYLAAQGLLRGGGSGDDDKDKMDDLAGRQDYSLEVGDTSVTLDWLAPESLPLFVGVNLYETWKANNGEMQLSDYLNAIKNVSEPMVEMSCLQSLDDVFNSVATARYSGKSALTAVLVSAATSYLTQALPTILGQAERTSEPLRMTTYTSKGKFATTDVQYFLGKSSARIPGLDYQQIPYIDAWGRAESNGTAGKRAANNFLNPAYVSTIRQSDMEKEIERLYEATEDGGVVPDRADKSIKLQEETKYLSPQEYVTYATEKGQKSYALAEELVNSAAYQAADDTRKADMIRYAYQYATAVAKTKVSDYALRGWQAKCAEVTKKTGLSEATYIILYLEQLDVEGYKDEDGDTIANSAGLQKMEVVYNMPGLNDAQRSALFEAFGVGKKIVHYNKAKVNQELGKLRGKAR